MHSFIKSIGFQNIKRKKDIDELILEIVKNPTEKKISKIDNEICFVEYKKEYGNGIGIAVRGEKGNNDEFIADYYYPYFEGNGITSDEEVEVEKRAENDSYAGICDDVKVGVSLIFYLQNVTEYFDNLSLGEVRKEGLNITLSGLAASGNILLPIRKNEIQIQNTKKTNINRSHLIAAARQGDEEAIESLTLEDIDTYTMISRRIMHEDVFSLVDSFFMPYGIESDQYSILGEILKIEISKNEKTQEELYKLKINCSDLIFDICINKEDLLGEPVVGRRFKGVLWLQGKINFSN